MAIVEFSIDEAPLGGLAMGTCEYGPTDTEKRFYNRLSEEERITLQSKPENTEKSHFKLYGHEGQFVSWFGIVRDIKRAEEQRGGKLIVQNTYAVGITDCQFQQIEISGAGDFVVELPDIPEDLIPLALVRVYGRVKNRDTALPTIAAEYVRVWHWGQFKFSDLFGEDHGNPAWKKRMSPDFERTLHQLGFTRDYYFKLLGPTPDQEDEIKAFHRGQTKLEWQDDSLLSDPRTGPYTPTDREKPYYDVLRKEDRVTLESNEAGHLHFQLGGHSERYVGWFGIVRDIQTTLGKRGGTLLVENKYYDDKRHNKLLTVSIHGAGNFKARLTNLEEEIKPLSLVRVYGVVSEDEAKVPVIDASFVRAWQLGEYNFADYGEEHGDLRWRDGVRISSGAKVYQEKLSAEYYIDRLNPTPGQMQTIRALYKRKAEQAEFDQKPLPEMTTIPTK